MIMQWTFFLPFILIMQFFVGFLGQATPSACPPSLLPNFLQPQPPSSCHINLPVIHPAIFRQGEGVNSWNVNKTREWMGGDELHLCLCLSKLLSSSQELGEAILSLIWDSREWLNSCLTLCQSLVQACAGFLGFLGIISGNTGFPSTLAQPGGDHRTSGPWVRHKKRTLL